MSIWKFKQAGDSWQEHHLGRLLANWELKGLLQGSIEPLFFAAGANDDAGRLTSYSERPLLISRANGSFVRDRAVQRAHLASTAKARFSVVVGWRAVA